MGGTGPAPHPVVGRAAEIGALLEAADSARQAGAAAVLALHGPPGIGKTALTAAVEESLSLDEEAVRLALDLRPGGYDLDPETPMLFAVRRLRPQVPLPPTREGLEALLRTTLRDHHGILILDGAESADSLKWISEVPANWVILVTSVRSLDLPFARSLAVEPLATEPAVELAARRLTAAGLEPERSRDCADAASGHPLLIELLCGWVAAAPQAARELGISGVARAAGSQPPSPSIAPVVTRLLDALGASDEADVGALPRHLGSLALAPTAFDPAMAAVLLELPVPEAGAVLERLARVGLLANDRLSGIFRLPRAVAEAVESSGRGLDPEGRAAARLRYARSVLEAGARIHRLYLRGAADAVRARRFFEQLWPHLWAVRHWLEEDHAREARRLLAGFVQAMPHLLLDVFLMPDQQIALIASALAAAEEIGDRPAHAAGLGNLGSAFHRRKWKSRAIPTLRQALEEVRAVGDRAAELGVLDNLGSMLRSPEELPQAISLHERQLEIAREAGNLRWEAQALGSLANATWRVERPREAETLYRRCLELMRELEDLRGEGGVLGNLGLCLAAQGRFAEALPYYERALKIARELDDGHAEWNWLDVTGDALREIGELGRAADAYRRAVDCAAGNGRKTSAMVSRWNLAEVLLDQGRPHEALPLMETVVAFERAISHPEAGTDAARLDAVRERLSAESGA